MQRSPQNRETGKTRGLESNNLKTTPAIPTIHRSEDTKV